MATEQLGTFLRRLRGALASRAGEGVSDAQLLERFVRYHDEAAFEVLVWRHGGLVLNVCGRLLRHAQDTEDVFQATFLALTRKAGSIGNRDSLASWLYKVAYRVALRVRARAARDKARPLDGLDLAAPPPAGGETALDLRPALAEEINRLPAKYRAPLILCYLEGKTTEEAARQLGCPRGTVCSRLSWARRRLHSRLTGRGLALSAAGLAAALAPGTAPAALVGATVRAVAAFTSGQATGKALPGPVLGLAKGVWRAMMLTKLKTAAALVVLVGALSLGVGLCLPQAFADKPGPDGAPALVRGTGDGVRLPPEMLAKVGIQVAEVRPRPAPTRVLQFPGSLALDPERLHRVRCRFAPAEVIEIGKTEGEDGKRELRAGDKVRKGQVLAVLLSAGVAEKKTDLLDALVRLRLDETLLERAEKAKDAVPETFLLDARRRVQADRNAVNRAVNTLRAWGIPQEDIDAVAAEAEEAGKGKRGPEKGRQWGRVELRAPADGTLIERNVSRNELIGDATTNLFQIARLDRLKVLVQVPEADLPLLEALKPPQRRWTIRAAASDLQAEGRIDEIGYLIDPNQQTAVATGFLDNPEGRWRAGQVITASVTVPAAAGEMVLPAGAVVEEGRQSYVFIQPDAKKWFYEQRRVAVVRRGRDVVHIRARLTPEQERQGLQTVRPGERVVTAGVVELQAILEDLKAGQQP
jgi:cobalt-zinc-cadmium efflux system membrane fusion protein